MVTLRRRTGGFVAPGLLFTLDPFVSLFLRSTTQHPGRPLAEGPARNFDYRLLAWSADDQL